MCQKRSSVLKNEFFLRHAHAPVLPEVLDLGADEVGFRVAAGVHGVVEHHHLVAPLRQLRL